MTAAIDLGALEECATIGGAMLWPSGEPWPSVVLALEPEHFSTGMTSMAWAAILDLIGKRQCVDELSVCALLQEWGMRPGALAEVCEMAESCPSEVNLAHWAKLVLDAGRRRVLADRIEDARALLAKGGGVEDTSAELQRALRETEPVSDGGLVHIRVPAKEAEELARAKERDPMAGVIVQTGIRYLDKLLSLSAGDLTIVAGRPSMGKTAFALGVAARAARDQTRCTAIFSLEQSAPSIAARLARSSDGVKDLNLYIDDRPALGVQAMAAALREMRLVRLVVVDYLQLVKLPKRTDRRDIELGDVTKALKAIAKERKCHVIALSQLNRSVEKRSPPRPMLSDLRDSGNLEEDADNVLLLYREEYYREDTNHPGTAEVIIGKQRNGPVGCVRCKWIADRTSFEDLDR